MLRAPIRSPYLGYVSRTNQITAQGCVSRTNQIAALDCPISTRPAKKKILHAKHAYVLFRVGLHRIGGAVCWRTVFRQMKRATSAPTKNHNHENYNFLDSDGFKNSYFPRIHLPSCYKTVCHRTVQLANHIQSCYFLEPLLLIVIHSDTQLCFVVAVTHHCVQPIAPPRGVCVANNRQNEGIVHTLIGFVRVRHD